jgi:hypothetical protein
VAQEEGAGDDTIAFPWDLALAVAALTLCVAGQVLTREVHQFGPCHTGVSQGPDCGCGCGGRQLSFYFGVRLAIRCQAAVFGLIYR